MPENQITDTRSLGELIRTRRTALGLRQPDLALTANVGIRFIVDIENGKEMSCRTDPAFLARIDLPLVVPVIPEPRPTAGGHRMIRPLL